MSRSRHQNADPGAIRTDVVGEKYTFKPGALEIIWGKDKRFWRIEKDQAAELIQVYWLEVTGTLKNGVSNGRWEVKFKVSFNPDAFGWNGTTVRLIAKVGKRGRYKEKKIDVSTDCGTNGSEVEWCNGDIEVAADDQTDRTIYFGLYEIWSGKWKGGLKIHSATLEKKG